MPLDTTASKRVPKLTERANAAIASSRKRRLSLSSQDETHDTPRQRVRTDDASPATADVQTTPVNASPAATIPTPSDTTPNPNATNGPEDSELDIPDETSMSDSPLPVDDDDETPEAQLSTLP